MADMGAGFGMLIVETIAKIRRAYFAQEKPIKAICREYRVSRKVVRKVVRSQATEFRYKRGHQPLRRIDPWRKLRLRLTRFGGHPEAFCQRCCRCPEHVLPIRRSFAD